PLCHVAPLVRFSSVLSAVPAPPALYTLSLHDALPIWTAVRWGRPRSRGAVWSARRPVKPEVAGSNPVGTAPPPGGATPGATPTRDRKSTRLNSSHVKISYAVFCLKKKNKQRRNELDV